jgi:hypothetical protein
MGGGLLMNILEYLKGYFWHTIKMYLLPFIIVILSMAFVFWRLLGDEFSFGNIRFEIIYFSLFFLLVSITTYGMKGYKDE